MKNLLTFVLCCWIAASQFVAAQDHNQDVVYLKNGGLVRGKIIENIPNQKIVIESSAKTMYSFSFAEIDRIEQEQVSSKAAFSVPQKGYYYLTQAGISFTKNENNNTDGGQNATLMTVNGYKFSPYLGIGVAAGIDWYAEYQAYPIMLDVRGDVLPQTRVTPYYFLQAGYAPSKGINFMNENNNYTNKGGISTSGGLGIKFRSNAIAWVLDIGFRYQQIKDSYNDWWWDGETSPIHEREYNYKRLFIRTGIAF